MGVRVLEADLAFNGLFSYRSRTDFIVLHHAAVSRASVEDIHRMHLARGYVGIGYHYYVRKDGSVYRGRPSDAVGAHCEGYNAVSVGVCAEGDYTQEIMPAEQRRALLDLVEVLKTVYPAAKVVGHCDLNATACPGQNFPLDGIKSGVKPPEERSGGGVAKSTDSWKLEAVREALERGLITQEHDPDEPADKAFVLRTELNLLNKIKEMLKRAGEGL